MSPEQKAVTETVSFVNKFNEVILFPLIVLLSAVAFLMFLVGCAEYIMNASNDSAREKGVKHITWGIIGLVVMVSAWAILRIATGTIGLDDELNCANNPTASGCQNAFKINQERIESVTP
jgi:uncharacterized membrane protein